MPAYDRPIEIRVPEQDRRRLQPVAVGAVIRFNSTDVDRIQAWLERAAEAGIIQPTTCHEFNPEHGGPVWYIP